MYERETVIATKEFESDAFPDNMVRCEVLEQSGSIKYTTFDSKKQQIAMSYIEERGIGHA